MQHLFEQANGNFDLLFTSRSGFTYPNFGNQDNWSHKAGYQPSRSWYEHVHMKELLISVLAAEQQILQRKMKQCYRKNMKTLNTEYRLKATQLQRAKQQCECARGKAP